MEGSRKIDKFTLSRIVKWPRSGVLLESTLGIREKELRGEKHLNLSEHRK